MTDLLAAPGASALPPTPTHYPYFGVTPNVNSLAANGFANVSEAVEYYDAQTGGMTVYRTFSSGGIGTWASGQVASVTSVSSATVHHSFKTWDATAITAWMNDKPDNGQDAFLSYFHEPENDGWNAAQILDWQQKNSSLVDLRDATGRTDIKVGPTLMGSWTLSPSSGRNYWRDWYVGPPVPGYTPVGYPVGLNEMDFLGWDPYNESTTFFRDPVTGILDSTHSIMNIHRITGRPIVVGEWGAAVPSDTDGTALAAWVHDYMEATLNFYATEGIRFLSVCYWSDRNSGSAFDFSLKSQPLALAEMDTYMAASRAHYGIAAV